MTDTLSIRRALAYARDDVRRAQDALEITLLRVAQQAITDAGGYDKLGDNAQQRQHSLDIARETNDDYVSARGNLRQAQLKADLFDAELHAHLDGLRLREIELREHELSFGTLPAVVRA